MGSSVERELKLSAAPGFHLPDLSGLADGVAAGLVKEGRIDTTYYDTPDLRLARWGCSLRFRRGEGWTLKLPDAEAPDSRILARRELTFAGDGRRPPGGALAVVAAYARRTELQPVARLSTWRRKVSLVDGEGTELAELVDDEVSVLEGRRVAARFREVEIELRAGGEYVLPPLLDRLAEAGAAADGASPKHVRALGPAALEPPEVHFNGLQPQPTLGELVRGALAACVESLLRHDPGVRLGGDPEDVHQARVAMRRLRSHLRAFGPVLEAGWAAALTEEVRWLGGELGAVRDAEVLADRLRGEASRLPAEDRTAVLAIAERAGAGVAEKRAALQTALDSDRYLDLLERLVEAVREPRLDADPLEPAAGPVVELARAPWAKLRKAVRRLGAHPADESLHRVRILTKRARYAAELAALAAVPGADRFAKAAANLQTVLGELQDSVVAQAWLRQLPNGGGRRGFVAGELYQLETGRAELARREWRPAWKRLNRPKVREWLA